jgi:anthranilate phosphoribosyltransferase
MMASVLGRLGVKRALVVHGHGGLDELSLSGPSTVVEVSDRQCTQYEVTPEDAGVASATTEAVRGGSAQDNATILRSILGGERGPARDIVVLNAAAALVAAEIAPEIGAGAGMAVESIESGAAAQRLESFIECSNSFGGAQ